MKKLYPSLLIVTLCTATTAWAMNRTPSIGLPDSPPPLPPPQEISFGLRLGCFQSDFYNALKAIHSGKHCVAPVHEPKILLSTNAGSCNPTPTKPGQAYFGTPASSTPTPPEPSIQHLFAVTSPKLFPFTITNSASDTWCTPSYDVGGRIYETLQANCFVLEGNTTLHHFGLRPNINLSSQQKKICEIEGAETASTVVTVNMGHMSLSQVWLTNLGGGINDPDAVIRVRPLLHQDIAIRDFTLSEAVIDIGSDQTGATKYGLVIPTTGTKTLAIGRLLFGFDPTKPQHPIAYVDANGTTVDSPVSSPTNLKLTRTGTTLTLSGTVAPEIVRVEAFRPPRYTGFDYIEQYVSSDGRSFDWQALSNDRVFVEWPRPSDASGTTTFSIPNLPLYSHTAFSACEWKNCSTTAGACAFGRGYVVIGYDSQSRPSMIAQTDSTGDATSDFTALRAGCELKQQHLAAPPPTEAACQSDEHLVNEECAPLSCGAHAIANNHACAPCGSNEIAQNNQCGPIPCPAGQAAQGGQCVAITCEVGQILQGTACVCNTANGYELKDFSSSTCVKAKAPAKPDAKGEKTKQKPQKTGTPTDTPTAKTPSTPASGVPTPSGASPAAAPQPTPMPWHVTPGVRNPSPCGPGLQRVGTFCVVAPSSSAVRPQQMTASPAAPAKPPSGGCTLMI